MIDDDRTRTLALIDAADHARRACAAIAAAACGEHQPDRRVALSALHSMLRDAVDRLGELRLL